MKIYDTGIYDMDELCKEYNLPQSYIEFLNENKTELFQVLFNSKDCKNFDDGLFYDIWNKEMLFENTFSDGPNYQIPLNIINDITIDFNEPDYFDTEIVKNMFAIGLQDSGFLCFNPKDSSLCVLYSDGFLMKVAPSFDFFIRNIKR